MRTTATLMLICPAARRLSAQQLPQLRCTASAGSQSTLTSSSPVRKRIIPNLYQRLLIMIAEGCEPVTQCCSAKSAKIWTLVVLIMKCHNKSPGARPETQKLCANEQQMKIYNRLCSDVVINYLLPNQIFFLFCFVLSVICGKNFQFYVQR
jgi:hypothetical protein